MPTVHSKHNLPTNNLESHLLLNLRNRQPRIQSLRTSPRTIQNSMAPIQTHTIIQRRLPLFLLLIPAIRQPPITLQQHRRSQILLAIPPIRRTRGRAAGAENAFVQPVKLLALFFRLQVFFAVGGGGRVLQVRLDGFVLFVELG